MNTPLSGELSTRKRRATPDPAGCGSLKGRQLNGVQFRRQVPLGSEYIADFFAPAVGLVVVDGAAGALGCREAVALVRAAL
jgi:very-short-patch-repair endonuclease